MFSQRQSKLVDSLLPNAKQISSKLISKFPRFPEKINSIRMKEMSPNTNYRRKNIPRINVNCKGDFAVLVESIIHHDCTPKKGYAKYTEHYMDKTKKLVA